MTHALSSRALLLCLAGAGLAALVTGWRVALSPDNMLTGTPVGQSTNSFAHPVAAMWRVAFIRGGRIRGGGASRSSAFAVS